MHADRQTTPNAGLAQGHRTAHDNHAVLGSRQCNVRAAPVRDERQVPPLLGPHLRRAGAGFPVSSSLPETSPRVLARPSLRTVPGCLHIPPASFVSVPFPGTLQLPLGSQESIAICSFMLD